MSDVKTLQSDGIPLIIKDQTARNIIATPYDPTSGTYGAGDVCINGNQGYKALVDISTPEAFDPTKWEPTTLGELYTELKSNLTDNITEANSLTYVKQGNKRRISMNLSTFGNFKTLYNGLSATDKPTNTFTAVVLVMTVELKYVKEGYIKIGNNLLEAKKSNGFNSANAMDDIADGSYIMGAIEWYVA